MKPKFIPMYMEMAEIVAKQSSAKRLQVGAIIVKEDRIISIGYNGMPAGWTNECEKKVYADETNFDSDDWTFTEEDSGLLLKYNTVTKEEVIHAEANAIAKLARSTEAGEGSTMFLTHAPCIHCAKQIYTAGIKKVFYRNTYRDTTGLDFLGKCGLKIEKIN
jgi:dCMP deaminase